MKANFIAITILLVLTQGCVSPTPQGQSEILDGIYKVSADKTSEFKVSIPNTEGAPVTVSLEEFTGFSPQRIDIFPVDAPEGRYHVQIKGTSSREDWSKEPIVIIAAGSPYHNLTKTHSINAGSDTNLASAKIISFQVENHQRAQQVAIALRNAWKLHSN